VPVSDLIVKGDDVVISTQGRAFWILDDVTPLRRLATGDAPADAWLSAPLRVVRMAGGGGFGFTRRDAGANPPRGARLRYFLSGAPADSTPVSIEILDSTGKLIRKFDRRGEVPADTSDGRKDAGPKVSARSGMNEFVWDLRWPGATSFEGMILWGGELDGPVAVPGRYAAKLTVGKVSRTESFEVVKDPRLAATEEDFVAQFDLLLAMRDKLTETHDALGAIRDAREQIDQTLARAKRAGHEKAVADSARALKKRLTAIEETLYQTKSKSEQDPLNYPIRLNNKLADLAESVASADSRPTDQSLVVYADLAGKIQAQLEKLRRVFDEDVVAFNRMAVEQGVPAVAAKRWGTAKRD
jgi:hypothetical protein